VAAASDEEARELLALALDDNEKLTAGLKAATDDRDMLELERGELADKLQAVEEEKDRICRSFAEALAAQGAQLPSEFAEDEAEEPELQSVREAVDAAVSQCPHLAFAARAFESADDSPFEHPGDVLDALLKLERLAALWARPGGIGGMDL